MSTRCFIPPAGLGGEFGVSLEAQESLFVPHRENVSKLRPDAGNARTKAAEDCGLAGVIGDLLVAISNQADKNCFDRKCDMPQSAWKSIPL